ncbi:hypothetical protein NN561_001771 [Cricetulus griseus]
MLPGPGRASSLLRAWFSVLVPASLVTVSPAAFQTGKHLTIVLSSFCRRWGAVPAAASSPTVAVTRERDARGQGALPEPVVEVLGMHCTPSTPCSVLAASFWILSETALHTLPGR